MACQQRSDTQKAKLRRGDEWTFAFSDFPILGQSEETRRFVSREMLKHAHRSTY
jgi:hypothetical protein